MGVKVGLTGGGVVALAGVAAVAAAGFYLYSKRGAISKAAGAAVDAVNPASSDNLVNLSVSAAGEAVTGQQGWTLGGQLADWFSPEVRAANEAMKFTPKPKGMTPAPGYAEVVPGQQTGLEAENARLIARFPAPKMAAVLPAPAEGYTFDPGQSFYGAP